MHMIYARMPLVYDTHLKGHEVMYRTAQWRRNKNQVNRIGAWIIHNLLVNNSLAFPMRHFWIYRNSACVYAHNAVVVVLVHLNIFSVSVYTTKSSFFFSWICIWNEIYFFSLLGRCLYEVSECLKIQTKTITTTNRETSSCTWTAIQR